MKKAIVMLLLTGGLMLTPIQAGADSPAEAVKMRVTCYLPTGNKTADGTVPYEGICAAKRDWIGKKAVVYTLEGEYVATFEIRDTGGHRRIKSGKSIDIYRDTMDRAREWIATYGDYMMVEIVD